MPATHISGQAGGQKTPVRTTQFKKHPDMRNHSRFPEQSHVQRPHLPAKQISSWSRPAEAQRASGYSSLSATTRSHCSRPEVPAIFHRRHPPDQALQIQAAPARLTRLASLRGWHCETQSVSLSPIQIVRGSLSPVGCANSLPWAGGSSSTKSMSQSAQRRYPGRYSFA
jgi:hypothetical protein